MKCPKCQSENPEAMKFCGGCGAKLERICPNCNLPNPFHFKFCGGCGQKLSLPSGPISKELSFDEKLVKIQRYLPKGLTQKILAQRDKIEGERKQVTVMFCDMEGFTSLSEKLDPEEIYALMDQVYEILIHKVHDYEGTVNQMTGDGIMALFGAPIALEDAPQRAIRSAIAIHRDMTRFNEKVKQGKKGGAPIKMRIGIHTGPVIVGTLGNDLRVEFTAVGDTVNLASRMEGLAEPGTTYVTADTFRLAEGLFCFESLGEKMVKGKEKPLQVYRVISPTSRKSRFEVSAEEGLGPFVGRQRELELLLDGLERSKEGRGQAISIVSEAGIGKSRLLYEFRKAVTNEVVTFLEGRCFSYSRHIAYHPVVDVLKANFDIQDNDGDQEIKDKVTKGLQILNVDEPSTLPYLLELLSVKDSGIDKISVSPEARKDRTLDAFKRIVLRGSELRPLIIAIEDVHWMDRSSEDVMKELLESIAGSRVFLIYTYRPEFVHTWGSWSYHSQITLNRLSNQESLAMMTHLLNTKNTERELEDLILAKTEGIPFFIEEFIKSLKDLKIIEKTNGSYYLTKNLRNISIPSTIQDVIMARVDHLPDGACKVLRMGSAIEREFNHKLIEKVTVLPEDELLSHLSTLKDAELLYERGIFPNSTYIFRHALTRDVVYDSILTKTRKQIHQKIGNAIEELYQDKIDEHFEALVNHFTASEDCRKVADYSRLACIKAKNSFLLHDAAYYAKKWTIALETLPQTEELQDEIIDARTALGFYLFRISSMAEAKESIDPIMDAVLKRGLKDRLGQIYLIIGCCKYIAEEDLPESIQYLEKAIEITEETGDFITSVYAKYMLGMVLAFNCDFEKAIHYFEMLLSLTMAVGRRVSIMKSNMSIYAYDYHGMVAQGYQTSEEAVQIAEKSGDIYSKAMAYVSHGTSCYYKGLLEEAEQYLATGINFTEKINMFAHDAVAHQWLGHVYFDLGKYQKAKDHYSRAIYVREHSRQFPSSANLNRIALMRAKLLSGEKDINLELMYCYARENRVRIYEGCMARYIGDILLHLDERHLAAAEDWIGKAIEADKRNGMRCDLGRDYALYGQFFKGKGDSSKVKEFLERAIGIFKECGADGWVRKTEEALSEV
ncbi:MAG: adenylate/guanylate cyclase domain-containing protein [Thermodesulfobacteriota bacterium]|jgi:class 3 adenylate cyclase/tetratricopeptide (TPR) repeat protein